MERRITTGVELLKSGITLPPVPNRLLGLRAWWQPHAHVLAVGCEAARYRPDGKIRKRHLRSEEEVERDHRQQSRRCLRCAAMNSTTAIELGGRPSDNAARKQDQGRQQSIFVLL